MNFRRAHRDEGTLEINVIPLIDILLVMLIFLASTTAFTRYTQLEVVLPEVNRAAEAPAGASLAISQDGRYALDGRLVEAATPQALADILHAAATTRPFTLTINADGQATHQSVITVMEAARLAGIERVNFAARSAP